MRACVVAAAIVAACTWPLADRADADTGDRVRRLLNAERAEHGLAPLQPDPRLARAAREHSTDMVEHGYFAHTAPDGRRFVDRIRRTGWLDGRAHWWVGEDLAWGIGAPGTAAGIVRAWMHSPEHRRVLLGRVYRRVGIGVAPGTPFEPTRGRTVTADFGFREA